MKHLLAPPPKKRSPNGFTLLEVVIALGLSIALFAALALSLDLYRRASTLSTEEIERGQLARAIFRQMEIDLRSCTFRPSNSSSSGQESSTSGSSTATGSGASGGTGAQSTSGTSQSGSTIDATSAYVASSGIVGDGVSLVIQAVRPARNLAALIDPTVADTAVPQSDLRSIVYFLSSANAEGLAGATARAVAGPTTGDGTGLARLDGDFLSTHFADATADVDTLASGAKLLAKEVTFLQFRYFDGVAWYDVWDSAANNRLPNAVEITLGFGAAPPEETETVPPSNQAEPTTQAEFVFRHIVALPAAEPPVLYAGAPSP